MRLLFDSKMVPVALMVVVSFGVYMNSLSGEFVYDDSLMISDNPWLKDIKHLPKILFSGAWAYSDHDQVSNYYRPLAFLIYMIDYRLFGLDPWGYHLTSVLLHAGVSILVFMLASFFMQNMYVRGSHEVVTASDGRMLVPLLAGLLFATHPIHSEPVMWISSVSDISFTLFYLLAFYVYVKGRRGIYSVLAPALFFIACLGKETALTLPIMLFAYDAVVTRDVKISLQGILSLLKRYIPFILVALAYFAMRTYALGGFAPAQTDRELGIYEYFTNILLVFAQYLGKLVMPINLNAHYTFDPIHSLISLAGLVGVLVFLGFVAGCYLLGRKSRVAAFCMLWIPVPLLPAMYFPGLGYNVFAERYLYLPSVGFAILVSMGLPQIAAVKFGRAKSMLWPALAIAGTIILLYSYGTVKRNSVWQNSISLWADTAEKSPNSSFVHTLLGTAYGTSGEIDLAIKAFKKSIELSDENSRSHYNLGVAYEKIGQLDAAIDEYRLAIRHKPDFVDAYYSLGTAYMRKGMLSLAIQELKAALAIQPDHLIYNNLGVAYSMNGRPDAAMEAFKMASVLSPMYAEAHFNLGVSYEGKGLLNMARSEYEIALRIQPEHVDALRALNAMGNSDILQNAQE